MRNSCSFVFYESVWKQYQILDARRPEAAKAFMRAVIEYGLYDIVPPEDDEVWMYGLEQTITSIDAAKGRREKNQEDGSKGGRPAIRFERELIEQKKQELKTWKAVAEFLGIDEKTLRKIRSNWEEEKTEKPEIPVNTGKNFFPVSPILDEENNETGKTDGKNGKNGKNVGKTENGKNLNVNVNVTENLNGKGNSPLFLAERERVVSQQPTSLPIPDDFTLRDYQSEFVDKCKSLPDYKQDILRTALSKLPYDLQTNSCWLLCALSKLNLSDDMSKQASRLGVPGFQKEVWDMVKEEQVKLEQRIHQRAEIVASMNSEVPKETLLIVPRMEKERKKEVYNIEEW
jgi:hypothetical protein|nr:MAG TPA: hypothetical protein [Caudoviricetes sp.]